MNEIKPQTESPTPPPVPADVPPVSGGDIVTDLLKNPVRIAGLIAADKSGLFRASLWMLLAGLAFHAVFGAAIGLFAGWQVAAYDALKAPLIALCALLLCLPSLYVFACVAGSPLSMAQAFALGCSCQALVGLLLVGLTPVAWLFAVSTASLSFIALLTLAAWVVAVVFASRYMGKLASVPLFARQGGIRVWFVVLVVVSLQMATCLRPLLDRAPDGAFRADGKLFFLAHFAQTVMGEVD